MVLANHVNDTERCGGMQFYDDNALAMNVEQDQYGQYLLKTLMDSVLR